MHVFANLITVPSINITLYGLVNIHSLHLPCVHVNVINPKNPKIQFILHENSARVTTSQNILFLASNLAKFTLANQFNKEAGNICSRPTFFTSEMIGKIANLGVYRVSSNYLSLYLNLTLQLSL